MKTTQLNLILAHLKNHGYITPYDALDYGCMRLASRISDLRRMGHQIIAERGKGVNKRGETVYFAVYRLIPGTIGERPVQLK